MATLELQIPDSQFAVGGKFYGQDKNRVGIVVGIHADRASHDIGGRTLEVTNNPISIEDSQFMFGRTFDKEEFYHLVTASIIEVRSGGTLQTPADLSTILNVFYQEL